MTKYSIIREFYYSGLQTLKRFPLTILMVFIVCGCILYGFQTENWPSDIVAVMMTGTYGVFLGLILHILVERYPMPQWLKYVAGLLFLAILIFLYFYWEKIVGQDRFTICSAVTYSGSLVLLTFLVALSPYLSRKHEDQQVLTYNRKVFVSYTFSALLALIAYAALSLALLAIDNLFDVYIPGKTYMHLLTIIGGVVWTFLFLSAFPQNYEDGRLDSYPAFRIIIQFIGIPVIVVYALILLFYALKNVMGDNSHEEWTLWLILWFYLLSFLIFCLNYSIRNDDNHLWSRWFSKWYLIGAVPISFLNIVGSWKTISQNGVTELSFVIATFSLFLFLSSLYLLLIVKSNFKYVLWSLFILSAVSVFGPFNMCSSSVNSQLDKLEQVFTESNMLPGGNLTPSSGLTAPDHERISGIMQFLDNRGALNLIKLWDGNNILGGDVLAIEEVYMALNIDGRINSSANTNFIYGNKNREIDVSGYDLLIPVFSPHSNERINDTYITFDDSEPVMYIKKGSSTLERMDYSSSIDLLSIERFESLELQNENFRVKILFDFIDIDNNNFITNIEGYALYKNISGQ